MNQVSSTSCVVEKNRENPSSSAGKKNVEMLRLSDLSHMSLEWGMQVLDTFQELDVFMLVFPIGQCRSAAAGA